VKFWRWIAVAIVALAVGVVAVAGLIGFRPPSRAAVGVSLAREVGGSTDFSKLPCAIRDRRPTICWVWDAQSSGQARYRVTGAGGDCWRATRVPGGTPETSMAHQAQGCVRFGDKVAAAL
jgi:hypothetical protein